jgi:hypothetical protein
MRSGRLDMAVQGGAKAVEEGDGAEPRLRGWRRSIARHGGRVAEQSLDLVEEDGGQGRDGLGAVGEEAAEAFRDGDDPLPHGYGRDDAVDEVRGGLRHAAAIA